MKLTTALAAIMLAAAMALAACGDDDDDDANGGGGGGEEAAAPATLGITASSGGTLEVSGTPQPGVTEITLTNEGKKDTTAQLIRVEGGESQQQVQKVFAAASAGKPIPDWFRAGGGPGTTPPGKTTTVTQELEEGTYYAVNDASDKPTYTAFEVSGEESGAELPESDAVVTAEDYSFEASGLTAGASTVVFENAGQEPHHVLAMQLLPGKTVDDARRFFKTDKGKPPVDFESGVSSSVIDGGDTMVIDVALKKGDYALVCFISDRAGGPPHAVKGMISPATVE